ALFTQAAKEGDDEGWVKGTLSLGTIYADHPTRAADIVVDYNWDNGKNAFGYEGRAFSPGVAGHGGSSPYEINIPLIASGPSFKKGYQSAVPTSNIDIVPTILSIYDLPIPPGMEGRVMKELLAGQPGHPIPKVKKETRHAIAKFPWGSYELILQRSVVEGHRYLDFTRVTRK
ncbi:MAG TPA: alkaline phosphatase family protein, partial [Chryseosolibacter sp.]